MNLETFLDEGFLEGRRFSKKTFNLGSLTLILNDLGVVNNENKRVEFVFKALKDPMHYIEDEYRSLYLYAYKYPPDDRTDAEIVRRGRAKFEIFVYADPLPFLSFIHEAFHAILEASLQDFELGFTNKEKGTIAYTNAHEELLVEAFSYMYFYKTIESFADKYLAREMIISNIVDSDELLSDVKEARKKIDRLLSHLNITDADEISEVNKIIYDAAMFPYYSIGEILGTELYLYGIIPDLNKAQFKIPYPNKLDTIIGYSLEGIPMKEEIKGIINELDKNFIELVGVYEENEKIVESVWKMFIPLIREDSIEKLRSELLRAKNLLGTYNKIIADIDKVEHEIRESI